MTLHDIEIEYWADHYEKNPTSIEAEDADFDPYTSEIDIDDFSQFETVIESE
jgi:hypothetical protein